MGTERAVPGPPRCPVPADEQTHLPPAQEPAVPPLLPAKREAGRPYVPWQWLKPQGSRLVPK